jgi:hypothetical protein
LNAGFEVEKQLAVVVRVEERAQARIRWCFWARGHGRMLWNGKGG